MRLAVLHGVNRAAVAKIIAGAYGLLTPTLIPPSWYIYEPSLQAPKYDPELAKSYLEKSGFTGTVRFAVIKRDPDTQIAEIVQSQLKQIGLDVQIDVLERQAWLQQVRGYQFDMGMLRQHVPHSDPDVLFGELYARDAPANYAGLKDEALFTAVANGRNTIEPEARREFYVTAQQILLDGAYYDYLFTRPLKDIVAKNVHGLKYESFGPWIYTEAWLAK